MSIFRRDSQYGNLERREMHSYIPGSAQVVLDVGCHTGYFEKSLKNECRCVVWGIEVNQESAEIARRHLDHVVIGYFSDELIQNNAFDVIVFNDVLEHIADPTLTLRLALMKLKKGGCIVASLPDSRHIDNLEHIIFDKDFRYETNGIRDTTHLRFLPRRVYLASLNQALVKLMFLKELTRHGGVLQ